VAHQARGDQKSSAENRCGSLLEAVIEGADGLVRQLLARTINDRGHVEHPETSLRPSSGGPLTQYMSFNYLLQ
jgi:hypothetical protein